MLKLIGSVARRGWVSRRLRAAPKYPHFHATIIQLGWLGSPRYRKILKKKLKKRRRRAYKNYAATTIQYAWFRSRLYQGLQTRKISDLVDRVEKLDPQYVDDYINGIERLIR